MSYFITLVSTIYFKITKVNQGIVHFLIFTNERTMQTLKREREEREKREREREREEREERERRER